MKQFEVALLTGGSTGIGVPTEPPLAEVRWRFGAFTLWETQRRLERRGEAVRLGPRSFDLLLQLVSRAGEFLGKDALLASVWAGVVVEEGSVRVHISTLRKALGAPGEGDACGEWITCVALRGYRFNARAVREGGYTSITIQTPSPTPAFARLPARLTELIGRDCDVEHVLALVDTHRLVTIVGTGGIGKTRVAVRAAECHQREHGTELAFVDLSPLISQDHVLGTIARSVGAPTDMPDTVQAIGQCLAGREVLLLIDNCEHVVDSLAAPIAALLATLPGLRILATSREALGAMGEYVLRLPALAVPDTERLSFSESMRWPSVRLLVERAKAAGAGAFNESHGPLLARITRQVDGIPLAIELVAARLGVQSVRDLALRLDDHMRLWPIGSRAAAPRHRTLAAALDWSVALLNPDERRLFRRLSVFRGRFDVASALDLVVDDMAPALAFDTLISLAGKSLVSFDDSDAVAPYRLLDTTRSHAASLLAQSGEQPMLRRRHALWVRDLMKAAAAELPELSEQAWGERYAHRLDDVRFALEVCLVRQADARTAASLVMASMPLWYHVSQVEEYRDRVAAALALVEQQPETDTETVTWLITALVSAILHAGGSMSNLHAACDQALSGALAVKAPALELQARWARCAHDLSRGEYASALQRSEALLALAQSRAEPAALHLGHRAIAMASHFSGSFDAARQHGEAAISHGGEAGRMRVDMVGLDPIVAAKFMLCRTLWVQGETAKALETASEAVAGAQAVGSSVSLCAALYGACSVALWSNEFELACQWIHMMREETRHSGLMAWHRFADWFVQGLRLYTSRDRRLHVREVGDRFAAYDAPRKEMLVTLCVEWVDDALIARVARGESQWCAAEVWRAAGWRSERRGHTDEAEAFYLRAIETARRQGAMAWERRAARSLASMATGRGLPA